MVLTRTHEQLIKSLYDTKRLECPPRHINTTSFDGARGSQSEDGLVMSTVPESHTVCFQTSGHTDNLVAHTDAENRLVPLLKGLAEF